MVRITLEIPLCFLTIARLLHATTLAPRGFKCSRIRLIVPPFPAASRPSNSMTILWPVFFTWVCNFKSSICSLSFSLSYSMVDLGIQTWIALSEPLEFMFFRASPSDNLTLFEAVTESSHHMTEYNIYYLDFQFRRIFSMTCLWIHLCSVIEGCIGCLQICIIPSPST